MNTILEKNYKLREIIDHLKMDQFPSFNSILKNMDNNYFKDLTQQRILLRVLTHLNFESNLKSLYFQSVPKKKYKIKFIYFLMCFFTDISDELLDFQIKKEIQELENLVKSEDGRSIPKCIQNLFFFEHLKSKLPFRAQLKLLETFDSNSKYFEHMQIRKFELAVLMPDREKSDKILNFLSDDERLNDYTVAIKSLQVQLRME